MWLRGILIREKEEEEVPTTSMAEAIITVTIEADLMVFNQIQAEETTHQVEEEVDMAEIIRDLPVNSVESMVMQHLFAIIDIMMHIWGNLLTLIQHRILIRISQCQPL